MTHKLLLKDQLFNRTTVSKIAHEIEAVFPGFKTKQFVQEVTEAFPTLELKARITHMAACLKRHLPEAYEQAITVLLKSLPPPNNPALHDNDFGHFIYAAYGEFIAQYGCMEKHLTCSLNALYEITQRFSMEYAIRYFLNAFPRETLRKLDEWSQDSHYHVRRLCSEGTRPKLPWAQKIHLPTEKAMPLLDRLFADSTRFVTRSVANHLNDLSKIDPQWVLDTLTRWKKSGLQTSKEMNYILRHALRTLIKQGDPKAMKFLGFPHQAFVQLTNFSAQKKVKMNTALEFSFTLTAEKETSLIVDYILYFQNKAGEMKSKKVFKLKQLTLQKNASIHLWKQHLLRKNMTTRQLFPGKHAIEIQINGKSLHLHSFLLQ